MVGDYSPQGKEISSDIVRTLIKSKRINPLLLFQNHKISDFCSDNAKQIIIEYQQQFMVEHPDSDKNAHLTGTTQNSDQQIESLSFSAPLSPVSDNLDLRGFDLSSCDLTSIQFNNCDLRLTNILANPTLTANHLRTSIFDKNIRYFINQDQASLIKILLELRSQHFDFLQPMSNTNNSVMFFACFDGSMAVVKTLLQAYPGVIELIAPSWKPKLSYAIIHSKKNSAQIAEVILQSYLNNRELIYEDDPSTYSNIDDLVTRNKTSLIKTLYQHFPKNYSKLDLQCYSRAFFMAVRFKRYDVI